MTGRLGAERTVSRRCVVDERYRVRQAVDLNAVDWRVCADERGRPGSGNLGA